MIRLLCLFTCCMVLLLQNNFAQDSAVIYYAKGMAKIKTDDRLGAIADFTKSLEFRPSDSAYCERGNAKVFNSESIADFNGAIGINPRNASAYIGRSLAENYLGNKKAAMKDINVVIALEPDSGYGYMSRAELKKSMGKEKSALRDYNMAVKLSPGFYSYYGRACIFFDLHDYVSAKRDCDSCILLEPTLTWCYALRSKCNFALGDKIGGCNDLNKISELGDKRIQTQIKESCK